MSGRRARPAAGRALVICLALAAGLGRHSAVAQGLPDNDLVRGGVEAAHSASAAESAAAVWGPSAARSVISGPVDADQYRLGPGDVLSLEYGGRASGSRAFTVDSEGRVRVPDLGLVKAAGRTLAEFRADLLKRLRPFLPGAALDLRLVQPRTFRLYVLGEVRHPGMAQVTGSARVLEAIEAAGGTGANASSRGVRVVRRDGQVVFADLERFRRTGDWRTNPYLEDGDRVIVPVLVEHMGVYGAVAVPGSMEFRSGDSLTTAIDLAGGARPEARLDSLLVVRFRGATALDTLYADLDAIRSGRAVDLPLAADDRVFVRPRPEWHPARQVTVGGEVRFPGAYAIEEGKHRVSDAVVWAGGFTEKAARTNVRLDRSLSPTTPDVEFDRLGRLSRSEMTNSEYQTFRSKLALRQSAYLLDFSRGLPLPLESDVMLKDGDRIDVGRLELAVRVDGSVRRPGLVAYQEGLTVSDYVRLAGGTTARAAAGDMRLTRAGSGATQLARDVRRVEPGDFIWVPEKKDVNFWASFRDVLIVAGQVATIVLVIHQLGR